MTTHILRPVPRDTENPCLHWDHPPTRREAACAAAIMEMMSITPKLYLWTITFKEVLQDEVAGQTMRFFWKAWQRKLGACSAIRIAEVHPGGHGIHFHIVLNRRYPAGAVWKLADQMGAGRVDVQPIRNWAGAMYVAKYLGKDKANPIFGVQKYSRSGFTAGAVRDMRCESEEAELWRTAFRHAKGTPQPYVSAMAFIRNMKRG